MPRVDPVGDPRADRRPEEDADRRRAGDVRIDLATDQVDERARGRRDADHQVARGGGDVQRDAHRDVHDRHLDDPAADPEEGRGHARPGRSDQPEPESPHPVSLAGQAIRGRRLRRRPARRRGLGIGRRGVAADEHRHRHVDEHGCEEGLEHALLQEERDRAADERADRREQLQRHPESQVGDVPLEVDARRGAAGHDHADERDADRLVQRQPEPERQQRDDQDARRRDRAATRTSRRRHRRRSTAARRPPQPPRRVALAMGRPVGTGDQGRRCCGAYGRRAT